MKMDERDSDYYRRIGGYQGPVKLTISEVGCPDCEAEPGKPCEGVKGPIKSFHAKRSEYRDNLNERARGDDGKARWYRHQFRHGKIPSPPRPCGTLAAYQRHKRNGEEPDDLCKQAARDHWREAKAKAST